jgi:hypothetical protein
MSRATRQTLLIGILFLLLVAAAAWSVNWMQHQRQLAQYAADDLAKCQALAKRIETLRGQPAVASAEAMGVQELGQRIEKASSRASLGDSALKGVFPQAARRVGDSPYMQKPTAVTLRRVSLKQLTTFLHDLTEGSGLKVRNLRIRAPRGEQGEGQWNAEATLTYLIYQPPDQGRT